MYTYKNQHWLTLSPWYKGCVGFEESEVDAKKFIALHLNIEHLPFRNKIYIFTAE